MPAEFQAATHANRRQPERRDAEQRAASVNRKQRLNQVREEESGHRKGRHQRDFMSMIGYGHDD